MKKTIGQVVLAVGLLTFLFPLCAQAEVTPQNVTEEATPSTESSVVILSPDEDKIVEVLPAATAPAAPLEVPESPKSSPSNRILILTGIGAAGGILLGIALAVASFGKKSPQS